MTSNELLRHLEEGSITAAEFVVLVCADPGLRGDLEWLEGWPALLESVQAAKGSVSAGGFGTVAGVTVVGTKPKKPRMIQRSPLFEAGHSTPQYRYRNVPGMRQPAMASA
jgi:hypothetical protein